MKRLNHSFISTPIGLGKSTLAVFVTATVLLSTNFVFAQNQDDAVVAPTTRITAKEVTVAPTSTTSTENTTASVADLTKASQPATGTSNASSPTSQTTDAADKAQVNAVPENSTDSTGETNQTTSKQVKGPLNLSPDQALTLSEKPAPMTPSLDNINSSKISIWVIHADGSAQVLAGKNENTKFMPATMTKLYTAVLAYDQLASRLDEVVTITKEDLKGMENARIVGFKVGEQVPITDLFYGTIIDSGGDAAQALARLSYGSEEEFVKVMNRQAVTLGLKNSRFSNSTGLTVNGDSTTTEDMARIMALAASRPLLARMMATADYTTVKTKEHSNGIPMESLLFQDIKEVQRLDPQRKIYIQGGRPGWSPDAAFTMTAFTRIGGKLLVIITAGAESSKTRFEDQDNLFTQILTNVHDVTIFKPNQVINTIPLKNGADKMIDIRAGAEGFTFSLPSILTAEDLSYAYQIPSSLDAPVEEGTDLGSIQVLLNKKVIFDQNFKAEKTYASRALTKISNALSAFYNKSPLSYTIIFLILIVITLTTIVHFDQKSKRRVREQEKQRAYKLAELERKKQEELKWQQFKSTSYNTWQQN